MHSRYGNRGSAVRIHNIDQAEIEPVYFQRFHMGFCRLSRTWIENVAFHDIAFRNMFLQALDELYGQQVRSMWLASVQLNAYFACHTLIDFGIDFQQSVDTDILREKNLGFILRCGNSAAYTCQIAYSNSTQCDGAYLQKIATRNLLLHFFLLSIKGHFIGV